MLWKYEQEGKEEHFMEVGARMGGGACYRSTSCRGEDVLGVGAGKVGGACIIKRSRRRRRIM